MSQKDYYTEKHKLMPVMDLISRKLLIHKQLNKPPRSYVVYSDLHGSWEKFIHWMKNGLGYFGILVEEALGDSYSREICTSFEQLLLLVNRTRFEGLAKAIDEGDENYQVGSIFEEKVPKEFIRCLERLGEDHGLSKARVLKDMIFILRLITKGDERRIIKSVPSSFLENVLKLYSQDDKESFDSLIKGIVSSDQIYPIMMSILVKLVVSNMFDKHINLGDTYDRGEGSDRLVSFYRKWFDNEHNAPLHYIWGNHDILWMGAAIGNPILGIDALRISMRYNNVDFLSRYGFDLSKLRSYAIETYKELPGGHLVKDLKSEEGQIAARICKTLLVIQIKLTVKNLRRVQHIENFGYQKELDRWEKLLEMLPLGIGPDKASWDKFQKENPLFLDCYFPTIDPEDRTRLSAEEEEIAADIARQFTSLPKLQKDMQWLFEKGESYRVVDNTLYFHAAIPCTADGQLDKDMGLGGKELYDFVQRDLKRIGERHFSGEELSPEEKMKFWHLWCGETSVFFCKSKMATIERAWFDKEIANPDPLTTWTEASNPYYKQTRDDVFLASLLKEFHAETVCMGHTPVKTSRQAILSKKLNAFLVDGGASPAYGDRGVVLIHTAESSYLTMHPSLDDLKEAESENRLPGIITTQLEVNSRYRLRDMDKGFYLKQELEAIDGLLEEKIESFSDGYFF